MNLKDDIRRLYEQNRRVHETHQYTVPSPYSYPYQWLWDSCFHAIVLSHFDIKSAEKELLSVIAKPLESGLLPHIIYWEPQDKLQFDWGTSGTSAITQPPIIAYATWRVFERGNNAEFLESMYPALEKHFLALIDRSDPVTGLIGIINPDESGEDNSPRFDTSLGLSTEHTVAENNAKRFALFTENKLCNYDAIHCMKNHFWVQDVAFNSYMIEGLQYMQKIAATLNTNESVFAEKEQQLKQAMRKHMLKDGMYWSLNKDGQPIQTETWSMFTPLLADVYTKEEVQKIIQKYLHNNTSFGCPFPIPTTATSEAGFRIQESKTEPAELQPNWRGPVWIAANWMVHRGLKKYDFEHEASILSQKTMKLVKNGGFREYYDPFSGKGMGAEDFTWGGLVLDMTM